VTSAWSLCCAPISRGRRTNQIESWPQRHCGPARKSSALPTYCSYFVRQYLYSSAIEHIILHTNNEHEMTTLELSSQLTALSESVRTTLHLIGRLSKLNFQPGSTPLESGDRNTDVCVELTQDIHEGLKQQEETLELLKSELEDITASSGRHSRRDDVKEKERTRLTGQAARLSEELKQYERTVSTGTMNTY